MRSARPAVAVAFALLALTACHKDDTKLAEVRQRLSVVEARLAALDKPPPCAVGRWLPHPGP